MGVVVGDFGKSSRIERIDYHRSPMTPEENKQILADTPDDALVVTDSNYQVMIDDFLELPNELRPSLKSGDKGVFSLAIQNRGNNLATTVLTFDLESREKPSEDEGASLIDTTSMITTQSIAVIPFIDLFKADIEKEAERVQALIERLQKRDPQKAAEINESVDALQAMRAMYLHNDAKVGKAPQEKRLVGQEAMADGLAQSLSASVEFYDVVWESLQKLYERSVQTIAEKCAMGEMTLNCGFSQISAGRDEGVVNPWQLRANEEETTDGISKPPKDERFKPRGHIKLAPPPKDPSV